MENGLTTTTASAEARKPADLSRLVRMVSEAQTLTADASKQSLIDVDYYDGHQWTVDEQRILSARGQPDIVINRTKASVNGILGITEQGHTEPRCWPRSPKDEDAADVATDVLRYVKDKNRFNRLKQDVFRDILVPGSGACLVGVDENLDVTLEQVRWEELIYDPKARRPDFDDARFKGIAKWMYADDVAALYPDKASDIEGAVLQGQLAANQIFQDRPINSLNTWVDRKMRRLLVVELYYRDNGWKRCVFIASAILEEGDSPYLDDKGRPMCPIEAQSAYVDRNNNRYGAVRDMRGPQDEINKRRSKLLHLVNSSQIQAVDPSAVEVNSEQARQEAARPDGVIPYGWQKVPTTDMASGQAQLLQEAKGEIERLGPNPAILGRQGADQSGRALLARQQAGMVELAVLFGALEDWELRVYRQIWSRVKQYWKAPMFIRVTDDEDSPAFIGLNQPVMGPPQVVAHPETGQPVLQPTVLGYKNAVAEMDVDITVDSVPDVANIQQEQFQDLVQLVGSNPMYAQQVPFDIMLELSAVPHKREIIDRLKTYREQQGAQAAQAQQMQQQLMLEGAQAKVDETRTKAELNDANAHLAHAKAVREGAQAASTTVQTTTDASMLAHEQRLLMGQVAHVDAQRGLTQVQAFDTLLNGIAQRQALANQAQGDSPSEAANG